MRVYSPGAEDAGGAAGAGGGAMGPIVGMDEEVSPKRRVNSPAGGVYAGGGVGADGPALFPWFIAVVGGG
jgi:hypothetical protein